MATGHETNEPRVVIGGCTVPPRLTALIRAEKWVPPSKRILTEIFGEKPSHPCFCGEAMLLRENRSWQKQPVEDWFGDESVYGSLGVAPARSIVIADLGPDRPIVLDYRESSASPRVIFLRPSKPPTWVHISAHIDELVGRLYPEGT